jgi:oligopeptide/dipeptide ABC transporter ATP-binding protein
MNPILEIQSLSVQFETDSGITKAVDDITLSVFQGETLGVVGESGSGKSVTFLSVLKLIPMPPGKISSGKILFQSVDLNTLSFEQLRKYRGKKIAMIFQEPMTALNPVFQIRTQMTEILRAHENLSEREAEDRSIAMLSQLGIPDAKKRIQDYPHHFSGGMRQRVLIAMALLPNPDLLIADEPTTALDATTQAQILELLMRKKSKTGSSLVLITHNLALVFEFCDRIAVLYGGKIQEIASREELFKNPRHPYTRGLLNSLPSIHTSERLKPIPGNVPTHFPSGCKFRTRCAFATDLCVQKEPELLEIAPMHWVRCHYPR